MEEKSSIKKFILGLANLSYKAKNKFESFFNNNPTRIIVSSFVFIILFGAVIIASPVSNQDGKWLNFWDSLFTTTSAVCVTGLVCFDLGTQLTVFGQIVMIALIQIGGLGFMTATTFLFVLLGRRITLQQRLVIKESFDTTQVQGIVKLINKIILYTVIVEVIGALVMMGYFVPTYGPVKGMYYSFFHSISAFCNSGMDVLNTKVTAFSSLVQWVNVPLLLLPMAFNIVLGGLGFSVIADSIKRTKGASRLTAHTKVVLITTGCLLFFSTCLYMLFEMNNPNTIKGVGFGKAFLRSSFQAVTSRTAGFAIMDQSTMTMPSRILTMFNMFIGASPGSTAGGIKTTTFVVLLYTAIGTVLGKKDLNIFKQKITDTTVRKAITLAVFASSTVLVGFLLISTIEYLAYAKSFSFDSMLFEVISAFSTTGLSYGITPELSRVSRFILATIMFIGRCGTITIGASIIFRSSKNETIKIKYPNSNIRLG